MNCTLNIKHTFALLTNAYLSCAQKTFSSTHHHQSNYLTAIGLGYSAIAMVIYIDEDYVTDSQANSCYDRDNDDFF